MTLGTAGLLGYLLLAACAADALAATDFVQFGKYQAHPTRLLAKYATGGALQSTAATLRSIGLTVRQQSRLVPGLVVLDQDGEGGALQKMESTARTDAETLLARIRVLEESGLFEYVQPSYIYTHCLVPNDVRFTDNTLWGLRNTGASGGVAGADIGAVAAWDLSTGSTNVIVAVVDTGIRYTHRDLAAQMWHNPGETAGNRIDDDADGFLDDVFGVNMITRSGDPMDDNDHGSHVSGTIGAAANDGQPMVGVAWKVRLMGCKFLASDGFGSSDDAMLCIDYAVAHGAKVINASWGGGPFERALLDTLTAARRKGVLFVAAAGNDFNDNDRTPFYPACYRLDNVIAVAAIDRADRLASFSNFGATTVHLAAPGVDIYSCLSSFDSAYEAFSGTSMAAPHVAGVAALILGRFPNASVSELRERLLSTVVRIPTLEGKTTTGGRLNAYRALSATPDGSLEVGFDPPEGSDLSARRPVPFYVTVTDLAGVTNATVLATVQNSEDAVVFKNDGVGLDFQANDEVYTAELTLPKNPGPFGIEFKVSAPGKTNLIRATSYNVAAPPLNDNFADALDIPAEGITLQWTNRFGTIETGEPKHAGSPSASASVWWNWVPTKSGAVVVDTAGSTFDTVVAVYTNSLLRNLKEIASADDAGSKKQGYVTFNAIAGVTYHIALAGFTSADAGMIRLRVEPGGGPDTVAPQLTITGPATGLVVTNANDPKVVVTGTAIDLAPNTSGIRQVQIQVNREIASTAQGTTNWTGTVMLKEGQNRIKVSATDHAGNASAIRSVTVTFDPLISPNDLFSNAFLLSETEGTVSGNTTRAGKETGEPLHAGKAGGKSIWWQFVAPSDGVLTLSTANSTFDTLLALYSNTSGGISGLKLLASNDNSVEGSDFSRLSQPIKGGQTYYIAVDGADGNSGVVQLEYSFREAAVYTMTVASTVGGSASPGTQLYEANSTVLLTATPEPFYVFDSWEGGVSSDLNPVPVIVSGELQVMARFRSVEYSDGFETGDLSRLAWRTSGNGPWLIQTNVVEAGQFAARSGPIAKGQKSSLLLTAGFRAGTGSFGLRVSSEPTWDTLEFYVNSRRVGRWSGEIGWTNYQFTLSAGTNTLEWRYSKDFLETVAGLDAAFIDNVDLPLAIAVDGSTPATLEVERATADAVQLTLMGQTNQTYILQSSSDLTAWTSIATNVAARGTIRWNELRRSPGSNTFFRAIVP